MRRAFGLTGHLRFADLVAGAHPERQHREGAEAEEQEIDRDDRAEFHCGPASTIMISTIGFLPVHNVAQRRTARRTFSRTLSGSPPGE